VAGGIAEVPEVIRESPGEETGDCLLPLSGGANQTEGNQAEPEIDKEAEIELERAVPGQWKGGGKEKIGDVAEDDGTESLDQIDEHRGFRHRGHGC
jgi:uncharacterized protein YjbJ (UPF0337 family)